MEQRKLLDNVDNVTQETHKAADTITTTSKELDSDNDVTDSAESFSSKDNNEINRSLARRKKNNSSKNVMNSVAMAPPDK